MSSGSPASASGSRTPAKKEATAQTVCSDIFGFCGTKSDGTGEDGPLPSISASFFLFASAARTLPVCSNFSTRPRSFPDCASAHASKRSRAPGRRDRSEIVVSRSSDASESSTSGLMISFCRASRSAGSSAFSSEK